MLYAVLVGLLSFIFGFMGKIKKTWFQIKLPLKGLYPLVFRK